VIRETEEVTTQTFMLQTVRQVTRQIEERLRTAVHLYLFLDFDGTLAPIEADPQAPRLESSVRNTLEALASREFLSVAIISGRALEDLYPRVGIPGLIYAGNHGLEISGLNLRFVEPEATIRREPLLRLCEELRAKLEPFDGVQVEFKGLSASVHYRRAAVSCRPGIQAMVLAAVARTGGLFHMNSGLKVFDVVPNTGWNKGTAVEWIRSQLAKSKALTVYLGDDTTDENAFRVLPDAITVKVGSQLATSAKFRLPDPSAVHELLQWLATLNPPGIGKVL
jgi:trehalose-phosphatase